MTDLFIDPNEVPFEFNELFFTRTDTAGIIQSGNKVFQRVSIYSWEELLNKPHKVVRHPDMPRAVFYTLWQTIKSGEPIGAYVKNRAKDGRHYWVYAIVTPVKGGYLSVRLRPSSDLFRTVQQIYLKLSEEERRDKLEPADSAALLQQRLGELGFDSYQAFMAVALGQELAARNIHMGKSESPTLSHFEKLLSSAQSILQHSDHIISAYKKNEMVPINFHILASQLGQDGAAISVISDNYAVLSEEMRDILEKFVTSAKGVERAIRDSYFFIGTARVQHELVELFAAESDSSGSSDNSTEMAALNAQRTEYLEKATASLHDIANQISGFRHSYLEMNRLTAGLEVMRVICKVECARHTCVEDRSDKLLGDLQVFQQLIAGALREIGGLNRTIEDRTNALIAEAAAA